MVKERNKEYFWRSVKDKGIYKISVVHINASLKLYTIKILSRIEIGIEEWGMREEIGTLKKVFIDTDRDIYDSADLAYFYAFIELAQNKTDSSIVDLEILIKACKRFYSLSDKYPDLFIKHLEMLTEYKIFNNFLQGKYSV